MLNKTSVFFAYVYVQTSEDRFSSLARRYLRFNHVQINTIDAEKIHR